MRRQKRRGGGTGRRNQLKIPCRRYRQTAAPCLHFQPTEQGERCAFRLIAGFDVATFPPPRSALVARKLASKQGKLDDRARLSKPPLSPLKYSFKLSGPISKIRQHR